MSSVKSIPEEKLRWVFEKFNFKRDPFWHQYVSMMFALDLDRVAFFHPIGSGKTSTAYYVAEHCWGCYKILVVCPTSGFRAWGRDAKWTSYPSYTYLTGTAEERREKLIDGDLGVFIINWEGLKYLFGKKVKRGNTSQWVIDKAIMNSGVLDFDCLVFDEVHRCKNHKSLQSKICLELSKKTECVIGLTGTPFDKDLLELFNVYKVIDLGESFGNNAWRFRLDYFHQVFPFGWEPNEGTQEIIFEKAAPITIAFSKEECYDLPECQEVVYELDATSAFRKWERKVITNGSIQINGQTVMCDIPSRYGHLLRELTAGFMYYEVGGVKKRFELKTNPKLNALLEVVDDNPVKMIVFYAHRGTDELIGRNLTKRGIKYVTMKGGQKAEDRIQAERLFLEDPEVQICLANVGCGSEAWEGHSASIVTFYDVVASPTVREQCIGRMLRRGQTKKTLVIELIIKKSIDETIKRNQGPRKDLVDSFLEYVQDYEGGK